MAERRMFAKSIVLSDAFLDMPMSARCLYFTFGMLADDDGFVGNPKAIMRQCGASQDDILALLQKRYILSFDNGVIVIKHWRMNNYLQNDRHKDTTYIEELKTLEIDRKGAYTEKCIQNVYTGKDSIGKYSIGKYSIGNTICAEVETTSTQEEVFLTLSLNDNTEFAITESKVKEFKECYPAVDVEQELRNMKAWCISNPKNRKTRSGVLRFVNSWLSKEQNRQRPVNNYNTSKTGPALSGEWAAGVGK